MYDNQSMTNACFIYVMLNSFKNLYNNNNTKFCIHPFVHPSAYNNNFSWNVMDIKMKCYFFLHVILEWSYDG